MLPTLQQFRYLVAIAETLHFRRAAESVNVTQPTLSAQLRELETKLGVELVERARGGVILTPVGAEVARRARALLRDAEDITALASRGADPFAGTFRIGLVQSLGSYFLPIVLPALHATYPSLKLGVREGLAADLLARLRAGTLDALFFPLPLEDETLHAEPLFVEPLLAVVPAEHALAQETVIARSSLRGETVMTLEDGHRLHGTVADLCDEVGANLSLDYEGTSLDTLRQMVATGLGLSILPALYVRSEVARERLVVARPLEEPQPSRQIGMVWRSTAFASPALTELAALIRDILEREAPELHVLRERRLASAS
jgi:LysR family hydrogen peroxide-inducible transcriptional activator